jgi:hypothetical protein
VAGDWRKLHNEELHNLYPSPIVIRITKTRRMRWAGHVVRMGETRNAYKILVGKHERKSPIGRPRLRSEDNVEIGLREIGLEGEHWINLAHDRDWWRALVITVMNLSVP